MLETTVRASVVHWCPYVEEIDVGEIEVRFPGAAAELHALAAFLQAFASRQLTHEELTREVATEYPGATVTSRWRTAGLDVEVVETVLPDTGAAVAYSVSEPDALPRDEPGR